MIISKEATQILHNNSWSGNVRELKSVIERASMLANGNVINSSDLMMIQPAKGDDLLSQEMTLEDYKIKIIKTFLEKYNNNIDLVAEKLNIGRATIYRILKRLGE